jgi:hypothetical protein
VLSYFYPLSRSSTGKGLAPDLIPREADETDVGFL